MLTMMRFWTVDEKDLIAKLFHEIEQIPEYEVYMASSEDSYFGDKQVVLAIIEKVFANNDLLHWYLGEKNTHWIDDYDEAMLMFYQNVKEFKENKGDECKIDSLFKSEEDEKFCRDLFRKTLEHATEYAQLIEGKLQNWERERVIQMDLLLMEMALCELLEFPSIPIKVTLNEYIEIAKFYAFPTWVTRCPTPPERFAATSCPPTSNWVSVTKWILTVTTNWPSTAKSTNCSSPPTPST